MILLKMLLMPKLTILPQALQQINEILVNVVEFTGFDVSAIRLSDEIYEKIERITFMPLAIGRLRDDGSREAFARKYRIVYDFDEIADEVVILSVIHSSRIYPCPEN